VRSRIVQYCPLMSLLEAVVKPCLKDRKACVVNLRIALRFSEYLTPVVSVVGLQRMFA
jgi:hypothetical protein